MCKPLAEVESVPLHFLVMERCQCSLRDPRSFLVSTSARSRGASGFLDVQDASLDSDCREPELQSPQLSRAYEREDQLREVGLQCAWPLGHQCTMFATPRIWELCAASQSRRP